VSPGAQAAHLARERAAGRGEGGAAVRAPFPWFGGKRDVLDLVWGALGQPKQYIEPFCGSAAMLLGARAPASLEVIGDLNGFVANFWRCVKAQPDAVARWADYPVSHIDLGARHRWLLEQVPRLGESLQDPNWPGDAQVAGWWLWGQCSWIGSGWCEWDPGKIPHVSDAGMGVQASGQIPHVSNAGMGVQASGQIPHVSNAGMGSYQSAGSATPSMDTSGGRTALAWLRKLAARLERVRVIHGSWDRCLNSHYGGEGPGTAVFLDPPYLAFEGLYGAAGNVPVARECEAWARANPALRIALCGHAGDYDLPGWRMERWERKRLTYSGGGTKDQEAIWFSPACLDPQRGQQGLFGGVA